MTIKALEEKYLPFWKEFGADVTAPENIREFIFCMKEVALGSIDRVKKQDRLNPDVTFVVVYLRSAESSLLGKLQKRIQDLTKMFAALYDDLQQSDLSEQFKKIASLVLTKLEHLWEDIQMDIKKKRKEKR